MSNTTDTFWDVQGVSLNTLAFNIETWGGDREAPPPVRGTNILIPYRPGDVYVEKLPDSRIMSLGMWVIGATEDGDIPPLGTTARMQFETNWQKLRTLLYNESRPFTLTKRFRVNGTGPVIEAKSQVEFVGGLNPSMLGGTKAIFVVDLKMAEPFFLGNEIIENFPSGTGRSRTIQVPGDYDTTYIQWSLQGAISNPAFWNDSLGTTLTVARSIGLNETAVIDVDKFRAIHTVASTNSKFHGNLTLPVGEKFWFRLRRGAQAIRVTQTSGTGLVQLKYRPRWI